ncbi:MAG: hypothetical protein AAB444_00295 [Patescibacteria group bacterium]
MNHKLTFALILLTLPLFGAGCGDKQTTSSVSGKADTAQADTNESAPSDEKPAVKPTVKDDDQSTPDIKTTLPEGWKVYRSEKLALSFAYPPDWYVTEDASLGILLTETPLPQPLPPDVLDVPVVIDVSKETNEVFLNSLREIDKEVLVEDVAINSRDAQKFIYRVSPDNTLRYFYRIPIGAKYIEAAIDNTADFNVVQSLLSTLSF